MRRKTEKIRSSEECDDSKSNRFTYLVLIYPFLCKYLHSTCAHTHKRIDKNYNFSQFNLLSRSSRKSYTVRRPLTEYMLRNPPTIFLLEILSFPFPVLTSHCFSSFLSFFPSWNTISSSRPPRETRLFHTFPLIHRGGQGLGSGRNNEEPSLGGDFPEILAKSRTWHGSFHEADLLHREINRWISYSRER